MSKRRLLVRTVFTFLNGLRRAFWKAIGPDRAGVHAVPLTEAGKVVLVMLTYAPGWRLPGGGLKRKEAPETAMLRELREEIGLVAHRGIERLEDGSALPGDRSAFFLVRGVVYRPRRSLEIEEVREFDPERLPEDVTPWTAHLVRKWAGPTPAAAPPAAG
ncbi:MAG TPA: NUDIX domain-containing protein [Allosphingosinicella sp.]|nr:NUDIX domain-containing protein [Allosphingosinicella sp.]